MNLDSGFDDPDLGPAMCLCCEEKPAICHDTDLGPVCADCSHHLGIAIGQLVQTHGIASHASQQFNR
jgi:hypothetical protein